ncbi:hypothetical protein LXA43DRAFT_75294 [Ganoderma leucocontextum]|nr:hypothetical protein LXA43DRAFT_75294 [Ganoderma leucocontextum]
MATNGGSRRCRHSLMLCGPYVSQSVVFTAIADGACGTLLPNFIRSFYVGVFDDGYLLSEGCCRSAYAPWYNSQLSLRAIHITRLSDLLVLTGVPVVVSVKPIVTRPREGAQGTLRSTPEGLRRHQRTCAEPRPWSTWRASASARGQPTRPLPGSVTGKAYSSRAGGGDRAASYIMPIGDCARRPLYIGRSNVQQSLWLCSTPNVSVYRWQLPMRRPARLVARRTPENSPS